VWVCVCVCVFVCVCARIRYSRCLQSLSSDERKSILHAMADALLQHEAAILEANLQDLKVSSSLRAARSIQAVTAR